MGFPEKAIAISVNSRKSPRGSLIGGSRSLSPDNNRAARASPRRICEGAIPTTIAAQDAKANQRAASNIGDSQAFTSLDYAIAPVLHKAGGGSYALGVNSEMEGSDDNFQFA